MACVGRTGSSMILGFTSTHPKRGECRASRRIAPRPQRFAFGNKRAFRAFKSSGRAVKMLNFCSGFKTLCSNLACAPFFIKRGRVGGGAAWFLGSPQPTKKETSFFLCLFVVVALHSLKYNSQWFNRQYRGLEVVTNVSKELNLMIEDRN